MKRTTAIALFAILLAAAGTAHAQAAGGGLGNSGPGLGSGPGGGVTPISSDPGCTNSPENATILLAALGCAGLYFGRRLRVGKAVSQTAAA